MRNLKIFLFMLLTILGAQFFYADVSADPQIVIPTWIKNNAKWWSQGQIGDSDFTKGIQYLVQQGIMKLPLTNVTSSNSSAIPKWVKTNAGYWSAGGIDDATFVTGIQYLIEAGIIQVNSNPNLVSNNLQIFFPLFGNPIDESSMFGPYMKSGDVVAIHPNNVSFKSVTQLKQQIPGIIVQTGGVSKDKIIAMLPTLPDVVDTIGYDYEPNGGDTPEFSTDQNAAIQSFEEVRQAVHQHGKQLMIEPVYFRSLGWDWGEVAKHTDILLVQMQNFQTGSTIAQQYPQWSPATLGLDLPGAAKKIVSEVKAKSPSTKVFVQLGFKLSPDPQNMIKDVNSLKGTGIDGILIMGAAVKGGSGDSLVLQVLQNIRPLTG